MICSSTSGNKTPVFASHANKSQKYLVGQIISILDDLLLHKIEVDSG